MIESEILEAWGLIEQLRAEEGDSVLILCDNPEGPPNTAIECNGSWTGWADKRFSGDNLLACLRAAAEAKRAVGDDHPEPVHAD